MKLTPRYDGPPILTFDGPPDDQRAPVARQRRRMEAMLAGFGEDEWQARSRCENWTVQDVVAHLVSVNKFWETSVLAGLAGTPTQMLATFDPAAHPPLFVDSMRELSSREVLDQFVASNDGFLDPLETLDAGGWSTLAESPPGHVPVRLLAQHALWDSWIHERDIALPLGLTPADEADEVRSCLRYAAAIGPALAVTRGTAPAGAFAVAATDPDARFTLEIGETVAVYDDTAPGDAPRLCGDAVELIEVLSIRAPLPAGAPAEWRRVLNGLATVFDAVPDGW